MTMTAATAWVRRNHLGHHPRSRAGQQPLLITSQLPAANRPYDTYKDECCYEKRHHSHHARARIANLALIGRSWTSGVPSQSGVRPPPARVAWLVLARRHRSGRPEQHRASIRCMDREQHAGTAGLLSTRLPPGARSCSAAICSIGCVVAVWTRHCIAPVTSGLALAGT